MNPTQYIMSKKWWTSSADPMELSATIKGLLMFYVPGILIVGQHFIPSLDQNTVVIIIGYVSTLIAVIQTTLGVYRKIKNWMKPKSLI